jgi:hypothetical protein
VAETVSFPFVERRTLMGGTLTPIPAGGWSSVSGCGGYIDTLLGPERTRECFSPVRAITTGLNFSHTAARDFFLPAGAGQGLVLCVV